MPYRPRARCQLENTGLMRRRRFRPALFDQARERHVAAFEREPYDGARVEIPKIAGLENRLTVFDAGSVKISATAIRNALAEGRRIAGQVPESVAEYITKQGLYSANLNPNPGTSKR